MRGGRRRPRSLLSLSSSNLLIAQVVAGVRGWVTKRLCLAPLRRVRDFYKGLAERNSWRKLRSNWSAPWFGAPSLARGEPWLTVCSHRVRAGRQRCGVHGGSPRSAVRRVALRRLHRRCRCGHLSVSVQVGSGTDDAGFAPARQCRSVFRVWPRARNRGPLPLVRIYPECFERVVADVGARGADTILRVLRVPPLRALAPVVARACTGLAHSADVPVVLWEELALRLAAKTLRLVTALLPEATPAQPAVLARVTRTVRRIEQHPHVRLTLASLAHDAELSPYHFLRTFERLTGSTPHQYILRTRLREAALRLASESTKVLDLAFDCGFGDVSNFNRTFRAEFGCGPRAYRRQEGWPVGKHPGKLYA